MKRPRFAHLVTLWWIIGSLAVPIPFAANLPASIVPQHILQQISDDDLRPLGRSTGNRSKGLATDAFEFPDDQFRAPAEYESEAGILVRWGSFNDVLTQIIVGVTTGDPEAVVFVVVNGAAQRDRATQILSMAGAEMKRVSFIHYLADSPWMRDYGPRFLEEIPQSTSSNSRMDGRSSDKEPTESLRGLGESGSGSMRGPRRRTILDHTYNRLRPRDNGFPSYLSALWGDTRYSMPLNHAGGNFHIFSKGEAFATERIESDNPGLKRWRLIAWFLGLAEIDLTLYPSFPSDFDQSGHIDMWMLPVSNHKVIVGQYPERFGQPHEITEKAVKDLRGRGYTVFRTPGWQSRGIHYTYTNALIFNHMVFVPVYKKFRQENRRALEVFENAFPQKQLIPVESSGPIKSSGALHCLVMNIPG